MPEVTQDENGKWKIGGGPAVFPTERAARLWIGVKQQEMRNAATAKAAQSAAVQNTSTTRQKRKSE